MTSCVSLQVLRLILKVKFCKCISRCLYLFVIVNFLLYIQKINFCGPAIWPKFIHISQHTNNKKKHLFLVRDFTFGTVAIVNIFRFLIFFLRFKKNCILSYEMLTSFVNFFFSIYETVSVWEFHCKTFKFYKTNMDDEVLWKLWVIVACSISLLRSH